MTRSLLIHLWCEECRKTPEQYPDEFNCFFDGCEYECCGCGRCTTPDKCSATGKGYKWHQ